MMAKRRSLAWLAAAAVSAAVLVPATVGGASGSGNDNDPSEGVTPTTVTIGGVEVASGEGGFTEAGQVIGAQAYFDMINNQGGVDGRKIVFLGAQDDGYSATSDVQIVQNLVEQKHVFAVVPVASNNFSGGNYLVQANIPFVGSGNGTPYCGTASGFGFFGCVIPSLTPGSLISDATGKTIEAILQKLGKLKKGQKPTVTATFNSSGSGPASVAPMLATLNTAGMQAQAFATIPASGVADYSPYVHQVLTSQNGGPPDAVYLVNAGTNVVGMKEGLDAAGYKGPIFDSVTYSPSTTQNAQLDQALQGEYSIIQFQPYEANYPQVKQMLTSMRKIEGKSYVPDIYAEEGYEAAGLFVGMLQKTGHDLTRATFLNAVNDGFKFSIPNLFGPIIFPQDHTQPTGCEAVVQLEGTNWKVADKLSCPPNVPIPASGSGTGSGS
jgi:branched-chain amino acid transport system substrate-binding protein